VFLVLAGHLAIRSSSSTTSSSQHQRREKERIDSLLPIMPQQNLAYDDEELSISLAPSNNRRAQNKPPDSSGRPSKYEKEEQSVEPTPQKAEQRIGAYHVIRTLGEGSFGKVKLAVHKVTNQQVALKIIARKKLISRDMAGRVEREIEYLQLLRHPHIIKL
jgi:carbon catabolite-derepressing protein kinase